MSDNNEKLSAWKVAFISFIFVGGIFVSGWFFSPGLNWFCIALSMFVFFLILGVRICGRPAGILINERKLMSLSRFQLVLWTLIILSAYATISLMRIKASVPDPLGIAIDWHLWALMGISTTSLVGTPLIYSTKTRNEPVDQKLVEDVADSFNEAVDQVEKNRDGVLYGNENISDAAFTDMFEGDELKNTAFVDMNKVQMFFFTLIAALSYVVLLFNMIVSNTPKELASLPVLPEGLIAILGISHAGYLTGKTTHHTKVQ